MQEIWKDIKGYEGFYQVSNIGRVKSLKHKTLRINVYGKTGKGYQYFNERILKGYIQNTGYLTVSLKNKKYSVHRLVAQAFIPNPDNLPVVNHKDGNKLNNNVENLEFCTQKHNIQEAIRLGLMHIKYNSKENRIRAKKLNQYDLDGNLIKVYECSIDAESELRTRKIRVSARNIRNVCNGARKTAGGYIWRYANE